MTPLLDSDIILHELGWSGQFKDKETGEEILLDFDFLADLIDKKIELICYDVEATEPPILYITNSEWLNSRMNKERKWTGEDPIEYVHNFRYSIATTKPYKGTRHNPKPFHFYNIIAYLRANYNVVVSTDGYEADDMMCMEQYGRDDTIICSRDKDLRICPGWHFSWECGKQRAIGPVYTDRLGFLSTKENGDTIGYGLKLFFYQLLVGDTADNIPGLPKVGDARAVKLLQDLHTEEEMFAAVQALYIEKMGDNARDYFREQSQLLWMVQQKGVGYTPPKKGKK